MCVYLISHLTLNSSCKLLYSILMPETKVMQLRAARKRKIKRERKPLASQIHPPFPLRTKQSPLALACLAHQLRHIASLVSLPGALKINDCGQRSIWNEIGANTKNLYNGKCSKSKQGTSREQKKKRGGGEEEMKRKGKSNKKKGEEKDGSGKQKAAEHKLKSHTNQIAWVCAASLFKRV